MRVIHDLAHPGQRATQLLVLLPPAKARLEDLIEQGFVAAVRARQLPLDIALAEVGYQQVMAQSVASDLRRQLIAPAKALGYTGIWLAGISLGGFNALDYAASHADDLTGIKLIAPYPGTADILNELAAAGGPEAWARDPDGSRADERRWWHWLWRESQRGEAGLPIWLGLGRADRFARGQDMLATLTPDARLRRIDGDHSWPVWQTLWQHWLDDGPFATRAMERTP
ncbi:alpha/beta hydrolase [Paludibacterium purpuratum]|uniref:Alpha/beta hydrolase n=1 Tax=Paludibacterium purpuratum TaxID=1144873 RepID=A0A4R7B4U8_9NEIS|nr:alpha/beta hydrolase [Paludibacterium purpuratum]TDR77795.1 hypothetical protein DFP86_10935 [Paludibacterium purpuratum]